MGSSDWPAVLCDCCHTRMVDGGFGTFIDSRLSLAPNCPACSAGRSMSTDFGEPAAGYIQKPWTTHMGRELFRWNGSAARVAISGIA